MPTPNAQSTLVSRLPKVGTTVFTVMSALATQHKAINLGQGFPDFECDPALIDAVTAAMRAGMNQYPPMTGLPVLRHAVANKVATLYGAPYDPDTEITITAGATQGILTSILALIHPGDEVIVLEPCYDSYQPSIELAGGVCVRVPLSTADYSVPWDRVAQAVTPKTKLLIINSPHNPTGSTLSTDDLAALWRIVDATGIIVLSDEVYEHMVFDGKPHHSVASHAGLRARSVVLSSFGKTFHVTGWKVGAVCAPAHLMTEFRKVHQFNVFTVNTPMQAALAAYLANPAPYLELPAFYQAKRDLFRAGLADSRFKLYPCPGTYFQVVNYSAIAPDKTEMQFAQWLTTTVGVAAIPISAFYDNPVENQTVRFCFAKKDQTLRDALAKLKTL
jgi:methionine transaminase